MTFDPKTDDYSLVTIGYPDRDTLLYDEKSSGQVRGVLLLGTHNLFGWTEIFHLYMVELPSTPSCHMQNLDPLALRWGELLN